MGHLFQRKIIIGVCGGIAAYKSAELVRLLQKAGADVRVIMTQGAQAFITPLTLQALSGHSVHTELLDEEAERGMGHIELARWADAIIVAPAAAETLSSLNAGAANNLLTTVCLASSAPIFLAPAMNQQMWAQPATQQNISALVAKGFHMIGPESGEQACGDIGSGRMSEPSDIVKEVDSFFPSRELQNKHVVITAGPTREAIDPVRYLSNHSSGKMGFALARAAIEAGAKVTLISGPVNLETPGRVNRVDVISALDMLAACREACREADIFIACAAVADYRPRSVAQQKLKKTGEDNLTLVLEQNPDIVATIANEYPDLLCVGFAAETENLLEQARVKRAKKQLDIIIANDVAAQPVFGSDTNSVTIISENKEHTISSSTKLEIARQSIAEIARLTSSNKSDATRA
jgi:phosphopantothenoylcysteine decarboxylase/phosphopantothenate--cysteine ligase